jgi:hypothetical protein
MDIGGCANPHSVYEHRTARVHIYARVQAIRIRDSDCHIQSVAHQYTDSKAVLFCNSEFGRDSNVAADRDSFTDANAHTHFHGPAPKPSAGSRRAHGRTNSYRKGNYEVSRPH